VNMLPSLVVRMSFAGHDVWAFDREIIDEAVPP
jgi:hypothetical protein